MTCDLLGVRAERGLVTSGDWRKSHAATFAGPGPKSHKSRFGSRGQEVTSHTGLAGAKKSQVTRGSRGLDGRKTESHSLVFVDAPCSERVTSHTGLVGAKKSRVTRGSNPPSGGPDGGVGLGV